MEFTCKKELWRPGEKTDCWSPSKGPYQDEAKCLAIGPIGFTEYFHLQDPTAAKILAALCVLLLSDQLFRLTSRQI
jgi:hypothetical protein